MSTYRETAATYGRENELNEWPEPPVAELPYELQTVIHTAERHPAFTEQEAQAVRDTVASMGHSSALTIEFGPTAEWETVREIQDVAQSKEAALATSTATFYAWAARENGTDVPDAREIRRALGDSPTLAELWQAQHNAAAEYYERNRETMAERNAAHFNEACQEHFPEIPDQWQKATTNILQWRLQQKLADPGYSEAQARETVQALLNSEGLDLMAWRVRELGLMQAVKETPANWPPPGQDGLPDFRTVTELEQDQEKMRAVLLEAKWQLRCAPCGENLLQNTARQFCEDWLENRQINTHTYDMMAAVQMGLMCSYQPRHTYEYTTSYAGKPWPDRLCHYSGEVITEIDESRLGRHTVVSQTGFWVSVQGPEDWAAINDEIAMMATELHHRVEVDQERILAVDSVSKVAEFVESYIAVRDHGTAEIDWEKMRAHYDGAVWVSQNHETHTALQALRRAVGATLPEANTGVIWNTKAVVNIQVTDQ